VEYVSGPIQSEKVHNDVCLGKYDAREHTKSCRRSFVIKRDGFAKTLQVCVVASKAWDWIKQLKWLGVCVEDPRVINIVIYTSLNVLLLLELGLTTAEALKHNTSRYLLHMVHELDNKHSADTILFTPVSCQYLRQ
jgi:hypothetical protein